MQQVTDTGILVIKGVLIDLFGLFPTEENIGEPIKAAIRYVDTLEKSPEVSQSRASLMNLKATRAWIKENYAESLKAFLDSNSPTEFVDMLSDWTSKALQSETDLIISRAVLLLVFFWILFFVILFIYFWGIDG